jgi:hypothetical protein
MEGLKDVDVSRVGEKEEADGLKRKRMLSDGVGKTEERW